MEGKPRRRDRTRGGGGQGSADTRGPRDLPSHPRESWTHAAVVQRGLKTHWRKRWAPRTRPACRLHLRHSGRVSEGLSRAMHLSGRLRHYFFVRRWWKRHLQDEIRWKVVPTPIMKRSTGPKDLSNTSRSSRAWVTDFSNTFAGASNTTRLEGSFCGTSDFSCQSRKQVHAGRARRVCSLFVDGECVVRSQDKEIR